MDRLKETFNRVFNERGISGEEFIELINADIERKFGGYQDSIKQFHRVNILKCYSKSHLTWSEFELLLSVLSPEPDSFTINVDVEFKSQTSDEASAFRQTLLRTKHFGVTPRTEGQTERQVPNRTTGESEVNHDGYMTGDDEFRRIDPKKFAEE